MSRERDRFEEDEIGKRIKREIDGATPPTGNNLLLVHQQQQQNQQQMIMGRRHMLGPGLGPGPGSTLNTITPCAACKLLRRRCAEECPFSPYFSPHEPQKFAAVHKVFGASNVSKMLMEVPEGQRADAANSLVYEANVRLRDPVYGCMGAISTLQQQVQTLQAELNAVRAEILKYKYREAAHSLLAAVAPPTSAAAAAAVVAAALSHHSPQSSQPSQPQPQPTPPQPPSTPPPPPPASIVVPSSSSPAGSLYTSPPPPSSNSGFTSLSHDPNHVPYFD